MRLLGFEITRVKGDIGPPFGPGVPVPNVPSGSFWGGSWFWPTIKEPFTGAWQKDMIVRPANLLGYSAVYACVTLIASDIAKISLDLYEEDADDVCTKVDVPAFSPLLRKPNRYQTRIKFIEQWLTSKLLHGNTYILKERDNRNVVTALYILDPMITRPLVTPTGDIYYQLGIDNLTQIPEEYLYEIEGGRAVVPASEIIHDTMVPLYHPLVGVTPLSACGLAALQGIGIQSASTRFFRAGSHPGGVLTAPGPISDEVARRIKDHWDQNFSGENSGKVAVLGDNLKFERMSVNAVDAQLIEQLNWTSEQICTAFHVPPYMIGVGPMPTYTNIEALTQSYYGQCLQILIETIEALLDEGLALPANYTTGFDLDDLLLMDTSTKVKTFSDGIKGGIYTPNEARQEFDLAGIAGGDEVYLQQQNFSLSALAKRDASADPFGSSKPPPAAPPADQGQQDGQQAAKLAHNLYRRAKQINVARSVA